MQFADERLRFRLQGWIALVGTISLISFASRAAGGRPPRDALYRYATAVDELVLFAIIFGVVLLIARGLPKREVFALRAPVSWAAAAGIGFAVLVGVLVLGQALDPLLHAGREQGLTPTHWIPARADEYAANFVVFGFVGPVVEELTFRGLGFTLLRPYGAWTAILLVGIAFGLWHGIPEALPVLTAFGIGLAYLRSRTGSVYPPIVLHASFNAIALVAAVAT